MFFETLNDLVILLIPYVCLWYTESRLICIKLDIHVCNILRSPKLFTDRIAIAILQKRTMLQ